MQRRGHRWPIGNPLGSTPIVAWERFVYDVVAQDGGVVVSFAGTTITKHDTFDAAVANAKLIAGNFWSMGRRSMVRTILADGSIQTLLSFG